jgi:Family of unknown function (DUF6350)
VAILLDASRAVTRVEGILRALLAGVGAVLAGLAVVAALVLGGWAAPGTQADAAGGASVLAALRMAGVGWLAAHHVPLVVPSGVVAWLPLGLLVVPAVATFLAGRWIGRSAPVGGAAAVAQIVAMSGIYAAGAAGVAAVASSEGVRAGPVVAAAAAFIVAAAAGSLGMWRAGGWARMPRRRLPGVVRALVAAGFAGLCALIGGGAVLTVAAVATNHDTVGRFVTALDGGLVGSALLLLLSAAYVPNAVIWAVAYAVGPGFSVGTGSSVAVWGVDVGDLPALPLLGALPPPGPAPTPSLAALLVPVVAGVIVGRVLARRLTSGRWTVIPWAAGAALVAGVSLGVLVVLSGGPLGSDRLAVFGPSAWQVAAATTLELSAVAAPTAWLSSRRMP